MSLSPATTIPATPARKKRMDLYAFGANDEGQLGDGQVREKQLVPTRISRSYNPHFINGLELDEEIHGLDLCTIRSGAKHTILLTSTHDVYVTGDNCYRQLGYCKHQEEVWVTSDYRVRGFLPRYHNISLCAATWTSSAYTPNHGKSGIQEAPEPLIYIEGRGLVGELGRDNVTDTRFPTNFPTLSEPNSTMDKESSTLSERDTTNTEPMNLSGRNEITDTDPPTHSGHADTDAEPPMLSEHDNADRKLLSPSVWGPGRHQFYPVEPLEFRFQCEIKDIQAGHSHYVALLIDGTVWGWGSNAKSQLGVNLPSQVATPTQLTLPFEGVCAVVCGKEFTYLVGNPQSGQHTILGKDKWSIQSNKPPQVSSWSSIHATWHSIYILFDNGTLQAWGKENNFQLIPPDLPLIKQFSAGSDHVLALTRDGMVLAWGNAEHGNCGDVASMPVLGPGKYLTGTWYEITRIPGRIVSVHAGNATSFVVTEVESLIVGHGETPIIHNEHTKNKLGRPTKDVQGEIADLIF